MQLPILSDMHRDRETLHQGLGFFMQMERLKQGRDGSKVTQGASEPRKEMWKDRADTSPIFPLYPAKPSSKGKELEVHVPALRSNHKKSSSRTPPAPCHCPRLGVQPSGEQDHLCKLLLL